MRWTRRPTEIAGRKYTDDWTVFRSGVAVGRVYLSDLADGSRKWRWASHTIPGAGGMSKTLQDALEAVRSAVTATLGTL